MKNFISPSSESCEGKNYRKLFYAEDTRTLTPMAERMPRSPCSTPMKINLRLWRSAEVSARERAKSSTVCDSADSSEVRG